QARRPVDGEPGVRSGGREAPSRRRRGPRSRAARGERPDGGAPPAKAGGLRRFPTPTATLTTSATQPSWLPYAPPSDGGTHLVGMQAQRFCALHKQVALSPQVPAGSVDWHWNEQKYVSSADGVCPLNSALQVVDMPLPVQSGPVLVQNFPTPRLLPVSPGWPQRERNAMSGPAGADRSMPTLPSLLSELEPHPSAARARIKASERMRRCYRESCATAIL